MRMSTSLTERRRVGCGEIYVHIAYREDGTFNYLLITPPGQTRELCGHANTEALARMITFGVRRCRDVDELHDLIGQLRNQRCAKFVVGCKLSCADAVADILTDVIVTFWETKDERRLDGQAVK